MKGYEDFSKNYVVKFSCQEYKDAWLTTFLQHWEESLINKTKNVDW